MNSALVVSSIALAITGGTAVLLAATGELLVERVGLVNIGIEGMMAVGALAAFVGAKDTHSLLLGLLAGLVGGAVCSILFAIPVVLFRADMIMVGFALWFIGLGVTSQLGTPYVLQPAAASIPIWHVPLVSHIPYLGKALFAQRGLVYVAFLLPFVVHLVLTRTRHGLSLRSIGESPGTADAMGIPVTQWRFVYVLVGGAFAGAGGAFLTLGTVETWLQNVTIGQGWIALAVVIFARWRPIALIFGAYLFGALQTLGDVAQALGWPVTSQVFTALPYAGTFVVIVLAAWARVRRPGWSAWPAALGEHFVRGA